MRTNYQVCSKQVKQNNQVCGYITVNVYDYGYKVELHIFTVPGGLFTKFFATKENALSYMNKLYKEYNY